MSTTPQHQLDRLERKRARRRARRVPPRAAMSNPLSIAEVRRVEKRQRRAARAGRARVAAHEESVRAGVEAHEAFFAEFRKCVARLISGMRTDARVRRDHRELSLNACGVMHPVSNGIEAAREARSGLRQIRKPEGPGRKNARDAMRAMRRGLT